MNKERLLALADHIEKLEHDYHTGKLDSEKTENMFTMSHYANTKRDENYETVCATPACIAGHALHMFGDTPLLELLNRADNLSIGFMAAIVLGLDKLPDPNSGGNMFYPPYEMRWDRITPAQAAYFIRSYAERGTASWFEAVAS